MAEVDEAHRQVVRRAAALLLVEYGEGSDDSSVIDAGVRLFRAAGGDAEPVPPGTVVAIFERVGDAAGAATRLHRESGAACRAGLHVGELLLTADATATRAAIDRASTLARLARPGTTAVTAEGLAALGRLRDADVEPIAGGVSLLIPRPSAAAFRQRRASMLLLGGAAVSGVVGIAWLAADRLRDGGRRRLTLGVGPFRTSGSHEALSWVGPALRDRLNAQLSELTGVQVFSDEFMDFVMTRESLSAIELAKRLGIEKMVTGSVLVVGDTVRVEARIIDVASGLLEGAYAASGREQDFLTLERDLVFGVVAKLALPLSPEDAARLAAGRTTNADALRRLLDAEGAPQIQEPPAEAPEPQSAPWDALTPRAAHAAEADADIMALLQEYRQATESRDMGAVAALYVDLSAGQRAALERFFANVRDLRVVIDRVDAVVVGDEAVVSYTRTDDFVDVPTARPQQVSVRLTKSLRRIDGQWRFTAAR